MPTPQKKTGRTNAPPMTATGVLCPTKDSSSVEQVKQRMDELAVCDPSALPRSGLLILLRGLPGVGKTKIARQLASRYPNLSIVISPDDHLGPWRPSKAISQTDLSDALAACKQAAWSAMRSKALFIIVDKDNLKYADMLPYVSEASRTGYEVHFLEPPDERRYSCQFLAKKNRRGLSEAQLSRMLEDFERYWTADEMLTNMVTRKTLSSGPPKPLIDAFPTMFTPCIISEPNEVDKVSCSGPVESDSTPDIIGKLMASTHLIEEDAALHEDPPDDPANVSVFEQLCELFPGSDRATLREIADATGGDLEWAAGLALEAGQSSAGTQLVSTEQTEELCQAIARPSAPARFPEETTRGPADPSSVDALPFQKTEGPMLSVQDSYMKLDTAFEGIEESEYDELTYEGNEEQEDADEGVFSAGHDNVAQESVADYDPPSLRITREFVRHAFHRYAATMDSPKIDLDVDTLPEEVFADWVPEPELEKSILSSFLRQLGYFKMVNSGHKNNSRATRSRFLASNCRRLKFKHTSKAVGRGLEDVKRRNQVAPLNFDPNLHSFENVLLEETAVRLSIEEHAKHFEVPCNQKALSALIQQFPGIDREILMETLVRCGFDLDAAIACIVAGVLDKDSFAEASRTSGFEAQTATLRIPSNPKSGDSLDKDADLSFQEILDEEEAISRSVADQSKNMQNLAIQLTLKRLVSQFPGFEKPYLINLFIKSGMDEEAIRQRLAEDGRAAEPLPPFTPLMPTESPKAKPPPASVTAGSLPQAKESLATLEKEIGDLRKRAKDMYDAKSSAKASSVHPGVLAFYNEELRTLRCRLNHREDLHRDLLVAIRSQEHVLAAGGRERADGKSSTRAALAFLDLHGLSLHHAMIALRRRLALLESGCPTSSNATTATTVAATTTASSSCPNFWLPKRLTVVTGWGSHASAQSFGRHQPHSVIRTSVINFLRSRSYDFAETPYIGCGCFDVKLMHRAPKQAKGKTNVTS